MLGALVVGRDLVQAGRVPARFALEAGARAEVALVPSGDPGGARTLAAARLYREGRAERLVLSGAGYGGDAATVLAAVARAAGVPEDRLLVETEATTTYENVRLGLLRLGAPPRSLVVVTSLRHATRAGLVAERLAPGTRVWVVAVPDDFGPSTRLREAAALLAYRARGWAGWW